MNNTIRVNDLVCVAGMGYRVFSIEDGRTINNGAYPLSACTRLPHKYRPRQLVYVPKYGIRMITVVYTSGSSLSQFVYGLRGVNDPPIEEDKIGCLICNYKN